MNIFGIVFLAKYSGRPIRRKAWEVDDTIDVESLLCVIRHHKLVVNAEDLKASDWMLS